MKSWPIVTVLLLCLVLVGSTSCGLFGGGGEEETGQQLVEVVRGDLTVTVSGSGNIEVSKEKNLVFGVGGRVDKIYVKEGDPVSEGDALARLETDALELALTEAQVSLNQAQVSLTQAQVTRQKADYDLKNILDTKDALELALLKAQINTRNAEHHLDETQDIYTWPDIETAQKDVDNAKAFLQYALDMDLPEPTVIYAQARLDAVEAVLAAKVNAYDTEEVAIAKLEVEVAEMAEAQARENLDDLAEDIAMQELQVESAEDSVEQAWQSLGLARQSLEHARKNLDEAIITAPFDGIVNSVSPEEGDTISTVTTIIHLVDLTSMELKVEVDEIDIAGVKPGQRAIIEIDALLALPLEGEVTFISSVAREESGLVLYETKIGLDVPEGSGLKAGMSAEADIVIDERSDVLVVPNRAVRRDSQGNPVVKVMVGEQIQERPVVTGISDGFQTEIVDGLNEGEVVVVER